MMHVEMKAVGYDWETLLTTSITVFLGMEKAGGECETGNMGCRKRYISVGNMYRKSVIQIGNTYTHKSLQSSTIQLNTKGYNTNLQSYKILMQIVS